MFKFLLLILGVVAIAALYYGVPFYLKVATARELVKAAKPFVNESGDTTKALLVLGDSTALGVGADEPKNSVAGRLAFHGKFTHVENYGVSGARTAELRSQVPQAQFASYHTILVQVGGNDILNFQSAKTSGKFLEDILRMLPSSEQVIVMSAGNVGATTLFPPFLRPQYTARTLDHHEVFAEVVAKSGGTYVNLYTPPEEDKFLQEPGVYLAPDGLHPSSEGYRLWFEKLIATVY